MSIEVNVGMESILNYKRLSYQVWYALAELIDNSTQSYFNNKDELDGAYMQAGKKLTVRVVYDRTADQIRVSDNAMGMSLSDLDHALQIALPPENTTGRSEFGLGLKTAACWLGDVWSVKTKRLGEEYEYEVKFDVESVAAGNTSLVPIEIPKPKNLHYTIIQINNMHQKLASRTVGKTKEFLRSMYRVDVRSEALDLLWDQEALIYDENLDVLTGHDGSPYRKDIDFKVGDRRVTGWVAVLKSGGRPKAGFAAIRRGRVIEGQPSAWRPRSIFGQEQGTNNLVNQRIVGEVHLDEFMVSHTKNAILWRGDEEEEIEKKLEKAAADYVYVADQARKNDPASPGPTQLDIDAAVDEIKTEMESPEFIDSFEFSDVPPDEVVDAAIEPVVNATQGEEATLDVQLGQYRVLVYLSDDTSPNDPYFAVDCANDLIVVVNTQHPYFKSLVGTLLAAYLRYCIYDALAEWKLTMRIGEIRPNTAKALKDSFLRLKMIES